MAPGGGPAALGGGGAGGLIMAAILAPAKALAVNPLKVSQPVGAALAFLGLARCMPLEHGARGCAAFNKLFFMRHFREPIALQTTAMDQVTTILGADESVVEALATLAARDQPEVVGLVATGLAETQGADIPRTIAAFRAAHPGLAAMAVVPVSATDTQGCLESGYALAVEAILDHLGPAVPAARRRPRQVNLLASSMLCPGDIDVLRAWIEAFGLEAVVLPDLGDSLDGHLIEAGFSTLTYGGTPRPAIAALAQSAATLVIGPSLERAARRLAERTGLPTHSFAGLSDLAACDSFTHTLAAIAGRPVPPRLCRARDRLLDAMVDCQFQLGGTRVALAADPDLLAALTVFLSGMGMEVVAAVASARGPALAGLELDEVLVGDFEDLERLARDRHAGLIIANSHGAPVAARLGLPLLRAGFPVTDVYGAPSLASVGYDGSRRLLFELANLMLGQYREIAPYRSRYRRDAPC